MKILERTQRVAAGRKETSNGREKKDKNRGKVGGEGGVWRYSRCRKWFLKMGQAGHPQAGLSLLPHLPHPHPGPSPCSQGLSMTMTAVASKSEWGGMDAPLPSPCDIHQKGLALEH